jgi:hypothetical protein
VSNNLESCPYCHGKETPGCYCIPLSFNPDAFKGNEKLNKALEDAVERFNALSIEDRRAHRDAQRESFIRAESNWPAPKFEMKTIDGVLTKVYASYDDYCNG